MKIHSKNMKILGYDLETTGIPEETKKSYETGTILKDSETKKESIAVIDGVEYPIDDFHNDNGVIKIKSNSLLIEINTKTKEQNIRKLPAITSYGYVEYELKTPSYKINEQGDEITINFNSDIKKIEISEFKTKINQDTNEEELESFISNDGKVFIIKDNLVFQKISKMGGKSLDKPLWDYFKNLNKISEEVRFFNPPSESVQSPEAVALTRLYQLELLKKQLEPITKISSEGKEYVDKSKMQDWFERFENKIRRDDPTVEWNTIDLTQDINSIWEEFQEQFETKYHARELSLYPELNKEEYSHLLDRIKKSDIIFGHNIVGFDNPLIVLDNPGLFKEIYNKTFIDTMLIPVKLGLLTKVDNLNKALGRVVKTSKLFDEKEKLEIESLIEKRKVLHDALLDIQANAFVLIEQLNKIYAKPNTQYYKEIINGGFLKRKEKKEGVNYPIETIIGITSDSQGFTNLNNIKETINEYGYQNIGISNYILNDFPNVNKILNNEENKAIITMKFKLLGQEVIAVLKQPIDQIALENGLNEDREMELGMFVELLKSKLNTLEFLVLPSFEEEYSIKSEKIGVRVDPFIEFDYKNTKFQNKRVLTVSPITDKEDINRFIAAKFYQTAKDNEVMTGQDKYLELLSWNSKDFIFGIPKKDDLLAFFPPKDYADIYDNANKIGNQSVNFDLYATNKREEHVDLEKMFSFSIPKLNDEMIGESIDYLNRIFKNQVDSISIDTNKNLIINGDNISKELEEEIHKEFELQNEKVQWKYQIKTYVDGFLNSEKFDAILYNYILLDLKDIVLEDVIPNLNKMDEETKVKNIMEYVNKNFSSDKEFNKAFENLKNIYIERGKEEIRVFNEMKNGDKYNTELSTFYYKYLVENEKIQSQIYKKAGVITGPGRGSSAGSLVAWAMNITKVDPVKYETIFERFTNEYKLSKPDIDTDHSNKPVAVKAIEDFTIENYYNLEERMNILGITDPSVLPEQKFLKNILNIVYFSRKTLFKGLAKALRMSPMNSKKLENGFNEELSIKENIDLIVDQGLKSYFNGVSTTILDILDSAATDKTLIRNLGKHASGSILLNKVWEVIYTDKGAIEEYGEKGQMPEKLDILGLMTLEIMQQYQISATIFEVVKELDLKFNKYQINNFITQYKTNKSFYENLIDFSKENKINFSNKNDVDGSIKNKIESIYNSFNPDYYFSNYNNLDILKMLKDGLTGGIFQMDARTQRRLLNDILSILEVAQIEKLPEFKGIDVLRVMTIINAVNRPGPLMAGMGDEIIVNLRNKLIESLDDNKLLDKYKEHPKLKRHIKEYEKNDGYIVEYYNSRRFKEFWTANIEEERRLVSLGEDVGGLISRMIKDGKTNDDIIEVFQDYERKMKNIPEVNKILDSSFETILYQEQIMQLSQELGGFTNVEADNLRKAVSKSNRKKIMEMINLFISGSEKKSLINPDEAEYLGIKFQGFGSYAFNKAHSQAYSLIGYQSAVQKITNPALFYAVNFNFSKMETVGNMVDEIEKNPMINLITGDINQAVNIFTVEENNIIIPLTSYKGVSEIATNKIIKELEENGEFTSFYNLIYRTLPELDKGTFQVLVKSGMLNDFIKADGLSVKSILENITDVFEIIKNFHYTNNPKMIDIDKLYNDKAKLEEEILLLEEEKDLYSNPVEIQIQIDILKEKIYGKDGILSKIEKGEEKNLKTLEKHKKELLGKDIKELSNGSLIDILKFEIQKNEQKFEKSKIALKQKEIEEKIKNLESILPGKTKKEIDLFNQGGEFDKVLLEITQLKNENKDLEVKRKAITGIANSASSDKFNEEINKVNSIINQKEDYLPNDFKVFRYELLKNYANEQIRVDFAELPEFSKKTKEDIVRYSAYQYNGESFIGFNQIMNEKYKTELSNNLTKPLWNGKNAKILCFVDFIPDVDDQLIEEFTFKGKTYAPVSATNYKPVLKEGEIKDKNYTFDNKKFIYNSETDELELHYKEYGQERIAKPSEYEIKSAKPKYLKYFHEVLKANGLSLHDVMILPAYPMTKREFKKIEESGVNITPMDNIFIARYKNILVENNIEFAVMTSTMNNKVINKSNLAGQETEIVNGKTYVLKFGDTQVKCFQLPSVNQGLNNLNEASKSFQVLLETEEEVLDKEEQIVLNNSEKPQIGIEEKKEKKFDHETNGIGR